MASITLILIKSMWKFTTLRMFLNESFRAEYSNCEHKATRTSYNMTTLSLTLKDVLSKLKVNPSEESSLQDEKVERRVDTDKSKAAITRDSLTSKEDSDEMTGKAQTIGRYDDQITPQASIPTGFILGLNV